MATGEVRGAFSMSEPALGSDVSAITTKAVARRRRLRHHGQKMWITNGGTSNLVAVLVKTDEGADSVYRNMTTFLVEKEPGFGETMPGLTIPGKIEKMGYKGVDSTELVFDGYRVRPTSVLGGETGQGLLPDDGRRRGRPRQRRRPRLRCRAAGVRARHRATPSSGRRSASRSPSTRR